jgi:hypothetical protein
LLTAILTRLVRHRQHRHHQHNNDQRLKEGGIINLQEGRHKETLEAGHHREEEIEDIK